MEGPVWLNINHDQNVNWKGSNVVKLKVGGLHGKENDELLLQMKLLEKYQGYSLYWSSFRFLNQEGALPMPERIDPYELGKASV